MSLGRKKHEHQQKFWVKIKSLPGFPRHVFYDRLNELIDRGGLIVRKLFGIGKPGYLNVLAERPDFSRCFCVIERPGNGPRSC